jgi:hypothetical protein
VRHPAYNLRLNKAVDRMSFVDTISRLSRLAELSEFTYYCLGGPYLEDCRLLYQFHPEIRMVSVEKNEETFKRQVFHQPCGLLELKKEKFSSFLAQYEPEDRKSIFWLDYTGLEFSHFEDFMVLLGKVASNSLIKITLQSAPRSNKDAGSFRKKFESLLPNPSAAPPSTNGEFSYLIQQMLQIASQKALPAEMANAFQPLESFYYSDGTNMFTLTGLVCARNEREEVKEIFRGLQFANLDWKKPREIDLPALSTKERLHVQNLLPRPAGAGKVLREALGYLIEEDIENTEAKLQQYADYHRLFPYFMRAVP